MCKLSLTYSIPGSSIPHSEMRVNGRPAPQPVTGECFLEKPTRTGHVCLLPVHPLTNQAKQVASG